MNMTSEHCFVNLCVVVLITALCRSTTAENGGDALKPIPVVEDAASGREYRDGWRDNAYGRAVRHLGEENEDGARGIPSDSLDVVAGDSNDRPLRIPPSHSRIKEFKREGIVQEHTENYGREQDESNLQSKEESERNPERKENSRADSHRNERIPIWVYFKRAYNDQDSVKDPGIENSDGKIRMWLYAPSRDVAEEGKDEGLRTSPGEVKLWLYPYKYTGDQFYAGEVSDEGLRDSSGRDRMWLYPYNFTRDQLNQMQQDEGLRSSDGKVRWWIYPRRSHTKADFIDLGNAGFRNTSEGKVRMWIYPNHPAAEQHVHFSQQEPNIESIAMHWPQVKQEDVEFPNIRTEEGRYMGPENNPQKFYRNGRDSRMQYEGGGLVKENGDRTEESTRDDGVSDESQEEYKQAADEESQDDPESTEDEELDDLEHKPAPPDSDELRVRTRVSDHEHPRDVPTKPMFRGRGPGGHWATPPPELGIQLGFVPKQVYTQVRRYDTVQHLPQEAALAEAATPEEVINAPRLREVVKHKKTQEVYHEEGYEDAGYDHGGFKKYGEHDHDYIKHQGDQGDEDEVTEDDTGSESSEGSGPVLVDPVTGETRLIRAELAEDKPKIHGAWNRQKMTSNEKSLRFTGDNGKDKVITEKDSPKLEGSVGKYVLVDGKKIEIQNKEKEKSIGEDLLGRENWYISGAEQAKENISRIEEQEETPKVEQSLSKPEGRSLLETLFVKKDSKRRPNWEVYNHSISVGKPKLWTSQSDSEKLKHRTFSSPSERGFLRHRFNASELPKDGTNIDAWDQDSSRTISAHYKFPKPSPVPGYITSGYIPLPSNYDDSPWIPMADNAEWQPGFYSLPHNLTHINNKTIADSSDTIFKQISRIVNNNRGEDTVKNLETSNQKLADKTHSEGISGLQSEAARYHSKADEAEKLIVFPMRKRSRILSEWSTPHINPVVDILNQEPAKLDNAEVSKRNVTVINPSNHSNNDTLGSTDISVSPNGTMERNKVEKVVLKQIQDHINTISNKSQSVMSTKQMEAELSHTSKSRKYITIPRKLNSNLDTSKELIDAVRIPFQSPPNGRMTRHPFLAKDNKHTGNSGSGGREGIVRTNEFETKAIQKNPASSLYKSHIGPELVYLTRPLIQLTSSRPLEKHTQQIKSIDRSSQIDDHLSLFQNPSQQRDSNQDDSTAIKMVEQLTLAQYSSPINVLVNRPISDSYQQRISSLADQLNTDPELQTRVKRQSKQSEEVVDNGGVEHVEKQEDNTKNDKIDSKKYPFYLSPPSENFAKYSPLRYALNPQLIPKKTEGGMEFYESRDKVSYCEEPIGPKNVVPERTEDGEWNSKPQPDGPRLSGLGDKIKCFKEKYFGEDPLDNPFFKETTVGVPEVFATDRTSKLEDQLGFYTDIMSNIRAAGGVVLDVPPMRNLSQYTANSSPAETVSLTYDSLLRNKNRKRSEVESKQKKRKKNTLLNKGVVIIPPVVVYHPVQQSTYKYEQENNKDEIETASNDTSYKDSLKDLTSLNAGEAKEQNSPETDTQEYEPISDYMQHKAKENQRIIGLVPPLPPTTITNKFQLHAKPRQLFYPNSIYSVVRRPLVSKTELNPLNAGLYFKPLYHDHPSSALRTPKHLAMDSIKHYSQLPTYGFFPSDQRNYLNRQLKSISSPLAFNNPSSKFINDFSQDRIRLRYLKLHPRLENSSKTKRDINWWNPKLYDERRGEPRYNMQRYRRSLNAKNIHYKNILSRHQRNANDVPLPNELPHVKVYGIDANGGDIMLIKKDTSSYIPRTTRDIIFKDDDMKTESTNSVISQTLQSSTSEGKQTPGKSQVVRLSGGFISRYNPAYSSKYTENIHNVANDSFSSNENHKDKIDGGNLTTDPPAHRSKVRFPTPMFLHRQGHIRSNLTRRRINGGSTSLVHTTTTTTTTTTEKPTTPRMYKPKRKYTGRPKGKGIDAFAVLKNQQHVSDKPETESYSIPDTEGLGRNGKPRRLEQFEHRRVTKEETFTKKYLPADDDDRRQSKLVYAQSLHHPDLDAPISRSFDIREADDTSITSGEDHTLTYLMNPKTGVGRWETRRSTVRPIQTVVEGDSEGEQEKKEAKIKPRTNANLKAVLTRQGQTPHTAESIYTYPNHRAVKDFDHDVLKELNDKDGQKVDRASLKVIPESDDEKRKPPRVRSKKKQRSTPRLRKEVYLLSSLLHQVPPVRDAIPIQVEEDSTTITEYDTTSHDMRNRAEGPEMQGTGGKETVEIPGTGWEGGLELQGEKGLEIQGIGGQEGRAIQETRGGEGPEIEGGKGLDTQGTGGEEGLETQGTGEEESRVIQETGGGKGPEIEGKKGIETQQTRVEECSEIQGTSEEEGLEKQGIRGEEDLEIQGEEGLEIQDTEGEEGFEIQVTGEEESPEIQGTEGEEGSAKQGTTEEGDIQANTTMADEAEYSPYLEDDDEEPGPRIIMEPDQRKYYFLFNKKRDVVKRNLETVPA